MAKVWCADCGHSRGLHEREDNHPCVLCPDECLRFVSPQEAIEVARSLKEQLALAGVAE